MRQLNQLTAKLTFLVTLFTFFVAPSWAQTEVEANNDFSTATFIPFTGEASGVVCPDGDVDYFKTVLPRDGAFRVKMHTQNTGSGTGNMYVSGYDQRRDNGSLFDATPAYYTSANDVTDQSADVYCRSKGDTIYFKVRQTGQCFSYRLTFEMIGANTDNDIEPNNTFDNATFFNIGDSAKGHVGHTSDVGTWDQYDYYKTVLPTDGKYRVYMEGLNTGNSTGTMHVAMFDQRRDNGTLYNGTPSYYSNPSTVGIDSFDLYCRSAGDTIYFKLWQDWQCYSYKITYKQIGSPTDNDIEPNNTFEQATLFNIGDTAKGHIGYVAEGGVTDGYDYFKTVLPTDGKYRLYMEGTNTGNSTGTLHVGVFDQRKDAGNLYNGTPSYYSNPGTTNADSVDLFCRSAGDTLYFKVWQDWQCYNYKITYKLIGTPSDNDVEPNNTFEEAISFNQGDTVKGHIGYVSAGGVTDMYDYYKTVIPKDGVVRVYMQATNTGNSTGSLYVSGYDQRKENGNLFNSSPSYYANPATTTIDSVDLYGRSAGDTFYFRVRQDWQCYNYKLSYKVIAPDIPNDAEPNNTFAEAIPFNVNDTVKGHIGYAVGQQTDVYDYYKAILPHEGTIKVYVDATNMGNSTGILNMNLFDSKQQSIYSKSVAYYVNPGTTTHDEFTIPCRLVDTTYFRMSHQSESFVYKFRFEVLSTIKGENDPEPNNSFNTAAYLNKGDTLRGNIGHAAAGVSDDVDYIKVKLPYKGTMRVFVEATNTGDGSTGRFFITGYDKNKQQVFSRASADYTSGGQVSVDNFNLYCRDADSFYFKIERSWQCYSYKLRYEVTLGADTTVYTCSGCKTDISKLYDVTPFSSVKYEDIANMGTAVDPSSVNAGSYMLSVINGTDECTRDTAIISVSTGQVIHFDSIPDKVYGDAPFVIKASSTAGLPVTFRLLSGPATVNGDTVIITGVGSVTIRAEQAGNNGVNYAFADRTFNVNKANATITLSGKVKVYDGKPAAPTAVTNPPSLAVLYTFNASSEAPANAGKYVVVATINDQYYIGSVTDTFVINKADQTLSITPVPDKEFGNPPFVVSANTSSGLPVTFSLVTTPDSIATVSGNTITISGIGTVIVNAVQNGNVNYNASTTVADTFVINKGHQSITMADIADHVIGDTVFLKATASSSLPVSYSIVTDPAAGVARLSGDTIILVGTTGNVTVTATQAGDEHYESTQLQKSFKAIGRLQTITFDSIPNKIYGDAPFALKASASSGLPVSFKVVSGPAVINKDTVTLTGDGTVVIEASQDGSSTYSAATAVRRSFVVTRRYPDLMVQNVTSSNIETAPGDTIAVNWTVANVGELSSATNWIERIYMQSSAGDNRIFIKQVSYANSDSLGINASVTRNDKVTIPAQVNVGDNAVFVVEVVPGSSVKEAPVAQTNNIGVQQNAWSVKKLLSVELSSADITEGAPDGITAKVTRTGSLTQPLTVSVSFGNSSRFTFPSTITIPAGQAAQQFTIIANNNTAIEGTIADTLRVAASGFSGGKAPVSVLDDDKPTLTITQLPADAMEGQTITFKVNTDLTLTQPLQVLLTSNNQARFPVPASVTIPAGAQSADVVVKLDQDQVPEVDVPVNIIAGAANHQSANATIQVKDDDIPGLELVLQTNMISEGAGYYATKATLRRVANSNPIAFTANLSANIPNTLILPATITLAAGENEKTFDVGVVDNTLADGDRSVSLTASIFVNSCGCSAPTSSSGTVSASLTVTDNDGPALTLTATPLTLSEGLPNAGTLKVSRNTSTASSLTVNLSSSNTGEATLPATVTIPAGQVSVDVPITTINDNTSDGNQQVYFQATTAGYSTGSVWVIVSDQNKPDLQVPIVKLPANSVQALSVLNYEYSVKNTGFATAPPGILVRAYLSVDNVVDKSDTLIAEDVISESIAAGQSKQVLNAAKIPNLPGQYKLLFVVNPALTLTEILTTNNTSSPTDITIKPDYTATAIVDNATFLRGTTIPVKGSAVRSNGSIAANEKVEVYIIVNGLRRTVNATTDANGNYSTQFMPLANEAGHYIVGASYPGIGATQEQDNFDILGVRINGGNVPQFKVTLKEVLTSTIPVQNMSNVALNNFTIAPVTLPNGATIHFDTIPALNGNASINLTYTVSGTTLSAGSNFEVANMKAVANEGELQPVNVYYYCQAPNAYVEASLNNINITTSQSAGERVVQLTLVNKGKGSTGDVSVMLPAVNWLTSVTAKTLPSIAPGDTAMVVLKFQALSEVPVDYPINGNIGISTQNGNSFSIPFTFTKASSSVGGIKVIATDQFTYYAASAPKVKGAHVVIKNYYTGQVYADGYTDTTGELTATGIPEGTHRIVVEKEQHQPYSGTVVVNPGQTKEASIFLNYQAITFNWTVVPTAIQDKYDITLETKFETNVPVPVVTIDMPKKMPQLSGTETYAFNAVLTNHGLITAKDVKLDLPTGDAEYEFITNYVPGDLVAQQSIQVPVIMRRRTTPPGRIGMPSIAAISDFLGMDASQYATAAAASSGSNCQAFTSVSYWYKCNLKTGLWEKGGTLFSYDGRSCTGGNNPSYGGIPIDVGGIPTSDDGGYNDVPCATCGPGGKIKIVNPFPPSQNEKKNCVQCINDVFGALNGCANVGGKAAGALSCAAGNWMEKKALFEYVACVPGAIPGPIGCAMGVNGALGTCAATSSAGRAMYGQTANATSTSPLGSAFDKIAVNLKLVEDAYTQREQWGREYFGNMIASDAFDHFSSLVEPFIINLDSIHPDVQAAVLAGMSGYELQAADINSFFSRWNTSVGARKSGVMEPNAQYPSIINWNKVKGYSDFMLDATQQSIDKGFTSVYDMYEKEMKNLRELVDQQRNAVCASVTMQLSQRLTMTREAFEGTLEIFNGHPTDKMDSLSVNIKITDENGVPSNDLFEIQTKSLTNLEDIVGTGAIASQQKAGVKFLFIPEVGAAPTAAKIYNFSGSVRYWDPYAKGMVTMPLSSVPLTVNPSPNLMLHYFMQRNILGDDALTSPDIEPSVPAELAVMVENQGFGPAVNMTISSAQPKITDNEKGLAVNFNLIGANFQGQPKKLGMADINFGTIPGRETRVGQWYFTSSLLGKFVSYDAKVVHSNSFGNPELSLVKGVKLHELTHSIKLYGTLDDGINDFLVNDIFDIHDVPDVIYFSQGNRTSKVYEAASGSFSSPVTPPTFTNTLTVTASEAGWNYINVEDPGKRLYDIASVTRSDGQVIPLDNAWLTFVTLPLSQAPKYENRFHFVDTFPSTQAVSYTVVWKPRSTDVPKVDTIIGVPTSVTATQVQQLKVVFNKRIDPATFTYEDMTLTLQGGQNIMSNAAVITQVDTSTFNVDLSALTVGNGFYALTVQAANVADVYGVNGTAGKQVTWTQMLNVPVVQAFQGIPSSHVANSFDKIEVLFNLPIDVNSVTPSRFTIMKDSMVQAGTISIDSVRTDHKLFYLSGLKTIMTSSGTYQLVVDLPNIKSETQVFGMEKQSVSLVLDNAGPIVVSLEKSKTGGLDPQHIPYVNIKFNEEVSGFNTAALKLTRDGEVLPLTFDKLSNTDLKTWTAGSFGMLTYPDGQYTFTIDMSAVKDAIGNSGTGTSQVSWTVNRSAIVDVSNLSFTPDKGYSNKDGVTAEKAISVSFHLGSNASQVTVYQVDLGGQAALATVDNVAAGEVTIPVVLATGGNSAIRVTATGENGGVGSIEKQVFIDEDPLRAIWQFAQDQNIIRQVDTLGISLSARLLTSENFLRTLRLTRNGISLSTGSLSVRAVNDSTFEVNGIRSAGIAPGKYQLSADLTQLAKYTSGKTGNDGSILNWTVLSTNRAPVAMAGNDTLITKVGTVVLDGSASFDADADSISYKWVAPEGIVLADSTLPHPSFNVTAADNGKTYAFLLIVKDRETFTTDVVNVTVDLVPGGGLPVKWLYLKGQQQGKDALLTWATVSEVNARSYVVERSLDGATFKEVGSVLAKGTSFQTNNYTFTDKDVLTLNVKTLYYRLRQVDGDGKFTYSVVVPVQLKQSESQQVIVKAYPNPFVQHITLQLINVTTTRETDHVALFAADGRLVYKRKLINRGSSTILLNDLPNLNKGLYLLQASIDGKLYTVKLFRQ